MTDFLLPKPARVRNRALLDGVKREPCLICRRPADPAHVRGVGAGGDDDVRNVAPICRGHHQEMHRRGWGYMASEYPQMKAWLLTHGWRFCDFRDKWVKDKGEA